MDLAVDNYNQTVEWGGASPTLRLVATDADHVPCVWSQPGRRIWIPRHGGAVRDADGRNCKRTLPCRDCEGE